MTEEFAKWFATTAHVSGNKTLTFKSGESAAWIDVDTSTKCARVTLWEDGDCVMQILDRDTCEMISWDNVQFSNWLSAQSEIVKFLSDL